MKKRVKVLIIVGGLFLFGFILFAATRYSAYTTYVPFTGRIFSISEDKVDIVKIQSGGSGDFIDYSEQPEIQNFITELNGIRYKYWIPDIPLAMSGWNYRIVIYYGEESVSYYFGESHIKVRGIIYLCSDEFLSQLTALFN